MNPDIDILAERYRRALLTEITMAGSSRELTRLVLHPERIVDAEFMMAVERRAAELDEDGGR